MPIFLDDRCAPRSNASSRALQATPEPAGVGAERRRVTACAETRSVPVGHDAWPRRPAAVSRRRGGVPGGAVRLAEEGADIIGFDICADDPSTAIQPFSARFHPLLACPLRCPRPAATGTLLAGPRPGSAHSRVPARRFLKPGKQNGFDDVTADRGFFRLVDLIEPKRGDQPVEGESALPP